MSYVSEVSAHKRCIIKRRILSELKAYELIQNNMLLYTHMHAIATTTTLTILTIFWHNLLQAILPFGVIPLTLNLLLLFCKHAGAK